MNFRVSIIRYPNFLFMIIPYALPRSFEDDIYYAVRREQREQSDKTIKKLSTKHLQRTETPCTLEQVRDAFGNRTGITISYFKNEFIENLTMKSRGVDFELTIAQFPQKKKNHPINLMVGNHLINHSLTSKHTPESVAEFMAAFIGWFPEYVAIEERVTQAQKQKQLACEIAFDMLKRTLEPILEDKGYTSHEIFQNNDRAQIRVKYGEAICLTMIVELLEDFLDGAVKIAQSLPTL